MDVILHMGTHRTGCASFQDYLRRHARLIAQEGCAVWTPQCTRKGLFAGVSPCDTAARIATPEGATAHRALADAIVAVKSRGANRLIVSDQNMLGAARASISARVLSPDAGPRVARYLEGFDGRVRRITLGIRSLEYFWGSLLSDAVARDMALPEAKFLRQIAEAPRSWRDVIQDIAEAAPGVELRVLPFERFRGQPEALFAGMTDQIAPVDRDRRWLNRSPELPALRRRLAARGTPAALPFGMGRWNPFLPELTAGLREAHADDMMWLTAGADGLAKLTEDPPRNRAGHTPPAEAQVKGHPDAFKKRQMARPG